MISKNYFPDTRLVLSITDSSALLLSSFVCVSPPPASHSAQDNILNSAIYCLLVCIIYFLWFQFDSFCLFEKNGEMMLSVFEQSWKIYLPLWQLSCIFLIEIKLQLFMRGLRSWTSPIVLAHNGPDSQLGGFCPKTAQIKMIKRLGQMFIPVSAL